MIKEKNNRKTDVVLKKYWENKEQFSDFFNAVLFDGKQVIRPEELEDMDTDESSILEHKEYAETIKASRDNIQICKKSTKYGIQLVMLGLESQEHIHYAMPMRVMGYDYGSYKKQYDSNAKKYKDRKRLNSDEFLSKMRKTDKFIPVITVVVYYGEKEWDGAVSLHGMLDIPEQFEHYVNDYKMILIEAGKNNLKLHNINNKDLFQLLGMLIDKNASPGKRKEQAINYAKEHKVESSVILTVTSVMNSKLDYTALEQKGANEMFTVFEETWKEGEQAGRTEGRTEGRAEEIIETGYEFGLSEKNILERLQTKLKITPQKAQEYLSAYAKQRI